MLDSRFSRRSILALLLGGALVIAPITGASVAVAEVAVIAPISVPKNVWSTVTNSSTGTIYVGSGGFGTAGTVSAIDSTSGRITATISVGQRPADLTVDEANNKVYVANYADASVSVIDGALNAVEATISAPLSPSGYLAAVAVNEGRGEIYAFYQSNRTQPSYIAVIDVISNEVTRTVPLGFWYSPSVKVAINPFTNKAYIPTAAQTIAVVDLLSGAVSTTVPVAGGDPRQVAIDTQTNTVYVTVDGGFLQNHGSVLVLDGATDTLSRTIDFPNERAWTIGFNASTSTVAVAVVADAIGPEPQHARVVLFQATSDLQLSSTPFPESWAFPLSLSFSVNPARTWFPANHASTTTDPTAVPAALIPFNAAEISTTALPQPTIGAPYQAAIATTGSAPYTFTVSAGSLPAGLVLNSETGVVEGVPADDIPSFFSITAAGIGGASTRAFSLAAMLPIIAPTIQTTAIPDLTVGEPQTIPVEAEGSQPITFNVVAGSLPQGIALDPATGILSGTPQEAGVYTFTLAATNMAGSDQQTFSVSVLNAAVAPEPIVPTPGPSVTQGSSITADLAKTGVDPSIAWAGGLLAALLGAAFIGVSRLNRARMRG
ncbi:putative Ig domain-containing protein [Plantibacter sp. RU18]|uniref:putative Ig domain-containing protein n=1 Tax=Plantibacter sp. RU18 TaxID=3158143 RepID=UPI003D36BF58